MAIIGFGDELMASGHVRKMQETDPRIVRVEYGKKLWSEVFDHNPRITRNTSHKDAQVYHARVNGLRPYIASKTPTHWVWRDYKPEVGELYFQKDELAFASKYDPSVIIEPNIKGMASPNKSWGWERWKMLVALMRAKGIKPAQLGGPGTQVVEGAYLIVTPRFRWAAAVLARAKAAVLTEGGLHHAAAAVGVRAVVIYGGYISPRQTGYDMHRNLFMGGTPCGSRFPCSHCAKAMAITHPETVMENLESLL